MKNISVVLVFLLFLPLAMSGQSYKLFTSDRELSSSLINYIFQDRNGMIWVATEDGLNRYDGVKFTIYKHKKNDIHSLCNNYVRTLFEDSKGRLFIGTLNGFQLYDPATDTFSEPAKWSDGTIFNSNIVSVIEKKNGELWISGNFTCKVKVIDGSIIMIKQHLPIRTTSTDYIMEDQYHNCWLMSGERGLYRIDAHHKMYHYSFNERGGIINNICQNKQGEIFISTVGRGIYRYDVKSNSFLPILLNGRQDLPVKTLYIDRHNQLFVGTDGCGADIFNRNTGQLNEYRFDNLYFDDTTAKVHSILRDNANNIWLAIYQKGVMMIPSQNNMFKYIGYKSINKNIIGSKCITSLLKDRNGILWVGTDNDGIYGISGENKQKAHFVHSSNPSSVPSNVFGLYEDSKSNLWFGSYSNGMGKLDRSSGRCSYIPIKNQYGNLVQHVYDFAEDKSGRLWIATMGDGLFYYDLSTNQLKTNNIINKAMTSWTCCLYYSKSSNKLFVGTYDGAFCIDLYSKKLSILKLLPRTIILSIREDNKGNIWFGCSNGLVRWNPKARNIRLFDQRDGLPSDAIYAIQKDDENNLWISTNAGVSQLNLTTQKFINYYVSDGLQGNEFSKNASFKDAQGNIWFGGIYGVTYFNPKEITTPARKWHVRITDFYLNNSPVRKGSLSGGSEIIDEAVYDAHDFYLSHSDNAFTIEFSTTELNNPGRILYLYSMNDGPWVTLPKGINRVSFSNLSPGTYRFKVKAKDYTIDSEIKEIVIHISPAWWASWWAKLIYTLLILGLLRLIILQVRQRYRTKQEMLQHIHAEQLNEAKLQFFINISHEIRTPMSLIISPLQKLIASDGDNARQKSYHMIYRNAERILRLINQLMDIRKIDKGQMSLNFRETEIVGFIDDLCETFAQESTQKNIELRFHHDALDHLQVWVDPANFDKIVLNILSNAFKFTPNGGNVNIYLSTGEKSAEAGPLNHYAEIIIADSGIGIDDSEKTHIFERFYQIRNNQNNSNIGTGIGLHLTRSLVELHHGEILVDNNPEGPGTRFTIRIPLGNKHLSPEEIDHTDNKPQIIELPAEETPITVSAPEEEEKVRSKSKNRVLVVEDDEEIRRYICQELSSDYHTMESSNGKEALAMIFKRIPDLVISDVMMPEMDGMTLCRKIKQNVNLNHIPVILLTAKTREEDNIEGLETGADAYLTKPFNIDILQKTVENLIRSRAMLRNTFSGKQLQEDKLEKIEAKSPDDKLMERIMKVINANLSNPDLTVEMITTEVGISRVHLHRKLKELTNQTTRDFIRNARLKQAAILLSEKKYSIVEVAELTGFNNPNNFSTAFKDLYGMPPSKYMEEHLSKENQE